MKHLSALFLGLTALASTGATLQAQQTAPVITVDGVDYLTWQEYTSSHAFQIQGRRCGISDRADRAPQGNLRPASDCSFTNTNPAAIYAPNFIYDIQVVVHIIQRTDGTGAISDGLVDSQIQILNEDFQAMAGSNGAPGTNTMFRFRLATVDPSGNPTTGITRSTNNTWYNDGGSYWNTLAWDTNRYLNIYTNSAGGNLGYVPNLPQGGIAGSNADRVVVLWSSFGLNGPIGPPYNLGRTSTHEVGHYLGLEHTFSGGCAGGNCYQNGDLICDTNSESSPNFGCPGNRTTCSSSDPVDNYMDYSDDICMTKFTVEQTRRMRCTIEFYRPDLFTPTGGVAASATLRNGSGINPLVFSAQNTPIIGSTWLSTISDPAPSYTSVMVVGFNGPATGPLIGIGELLLARPIDRRFMGTGSHSLTIPNSIGLIGRTVITQGATIVNGVTTLTNAIDLVIGDI